MAEMTHQQRSRQQASDKANASQRSSGRVMEDNRPGSQLIKQLKPNKTGLPDNLKAGMESLSGISLDQVRVHRNSSKPATVQAHAFAQGADIHLASGQEHHLPHELGHVVQQAQGRVQATTSVGGMAVNDNAGLEREADFMGRRAVSVAQEGVAQNVSRYGEKQAGVNFLSSKQLQSTNVTTQLMPQNIYRTAVPKQKNGIDWDTKLTCKHTSTANNQTATVAGKRIAVMKKPVDGGVPTVDPKGWDWLRAKFLRLKGSWVRFHIINAKLGGPGNDPFNLLPTTHILNHDIGWRNIEENAKTNTAKNWTYLEVTPVYDSAYPAGIPSSVSAEWGNWDGKSWQKKGNLSQISQQNPALQSSDYGDASKLTLGQLNGLITSFMPSSSKVIRKNKNKPSVTKSKSSSKISPLSKAIRKNKNKPSVTKAYYAEKALKFLKRKYKNQAELEGEWDTFFSNFDDDTQSRPFKIWNKIRDQFYVDDEGKGPYSLVFRKAK